MTITFQKSLAAALLTGVVAFATPVLLHAQTTAAPKASGSATTSGSVQAPASNAASDAAGANAAGAANMNTNTNVNGTSTSTGTYGGLGTDSTTTTPKKNSNSTINNLGTTSNSPQSNPSMTTSPH